MSEPADTSPRPPLTWERIEVGGVYADLAIDVDQRGFDAYAAAVRGATGSKPAPGRAAHIMASSWTIPRVCFRNWQVPNGALHAGQSWRFLREVAAGDRLRLVTTAAEKFETRGRRFVVFKSEIADSAGRPVGIGTMTMVWPQ